LEHPEILVHWTSRQLAEQSPAESGIQDGYVAQLCSIYTKGLRFSCSSTPDIVVGVNCNTELPTLPIICFTELRLSRVQEHVRQYGGLGIGFRREFLMAWGANPVFYMQSKNQGIVNTNLSGLAALQKNFKELQVFLSYVKPMGETYSYQYQFYDESEWRIVACKLGDRWPERFVETEGNVWFRFKPEEVALLAFPNAATRKKALADSQLVGIFDDHMPMMVDTSDCVGF